MANTDPQVLKAQEILNGIRMRNHTLWDILETDGIMGPKTQCAIMEFQAYMNIPVTGILDSVTLANLAAHNTQFMPSKESSVMLHGYVVMYDTPLSYINEAMDSAKPNYDTSGITDKSCLALMMDYVLNFMNNVKQFIDREIEYVKSIKKANLTAIKQHYITFAMQLDPRMKKMKDSLLKLMGKETKRPGKLKKSLRANGNDIIEELRRFDIVGKVKKYLKSIGISGKFNINTPKGKVKVRVTWNGITTAWSLKDILWDLCCYNEWGTEEWKARLYKHFTKFLDDFVIGLTAYVIAELLVGGALVVAGVTVASGTVAIFVGVVAVLIAALIGMFFDKANFSFSDIAIKGYKLIGNLVLD